MADPTAPIGEFEREDYTFAVHPDGEVHRVESRKGDEAGALVCHVYPYSYSEWSSNWVRDSWRPWIDQEARRVIAEAEQTHDFRADTAAAQPDHISE